MFQTDPSNNGFFFTGGVDVGDTSVQATIGTGSAAPVAAAPNRLTLANPVVLILLIAAVVVVFR